MDLLDLGYTKPLYILPFDHRATFAKKMFGLASEADLNVEQKHLIAEFKMLIYKGFKDAVEKVIPMDYAAILCDEEYGSAVLADAQVNRYITMLTLEKSGETEFKFAFENFEEHINKYHPTFAKVLIRYNPADSDDLKQRQKKNLKLVSDFCHSNNYKFLLELLVAPTDEQLKENGGSMAKYDKEMRADLTREVVKDLQAFGIEPDIWKLEGFETVKDYEKVINVIKIGGRKNVNLVVLGRGAGEEKVDEWLEKGAKAEWLEVGPKLEGVVGFAVGRTIFWDALEKFYKGEIGKAEVINSVSENFQKFYHVFASLS
jgi:myo-inositol catabolism protein IolC